MNINKCWYFSDFNLINFFNLSFNFKTILYKLALIIYHIFYHSYLLFNKCLDFKAGKTFVLECITLNIRTLTACKITFICGSELTDCLIVWRYWIFYVFWSQRQSTGSQKICVGPGKSLLHQTNLISNVTQYSFPQFWIRNIAPATIHFSVHVMQSQCLCKGSVGREKGTMNLCPSPLFVNISDKHLHIMFHQSLDLFSISLDTLCKIPQKIEGGRTKHRV